MQTVKYKFGDRPDTHGSVLALGFFDGVHVGHRELIGYTVCEAKRRGVPSAVFTFAYGGGIKPSSPPIYSEVEREEIFASLGVDFCIVADFSELCSMSAGDFARHVVLGDLGASLAVAGYNYRFGKGGLGDAARLSEIMRENGREAYIFDELCVRGEPVSSTRVRHLLDEGRVREAWELLGLPFFIGGRVEHGRSDGRRFGYPTINIPARKSGATLKRGVYLTAVKIGENLYTGLTNVGECPSFGAREYHTETFLDDFSGDLYEMKIKVYFLDFLREEKVFSSAKELGEAIEKDRERAERIKGEIQWQELGQSLL